MTSKEEITLLLKKHKKLFLQELKESKELVFLLKKSVTIKLTDEEKGKVKQQLLDICKAIPAFTVFMLPGGAILLPLLIKMVPTILPSAYREESDEEE